MKNNFKIVAFLFVLVIAFSINLEIGNKHFIQVGVNKVEATTMVTENIKVTDFRLYRKARLEDDNEGSYTITTEESITFNLDDYIERRPKTDVIVSGSVVSKGVEYTGNDPPMYRYDSIFKIFNIRLNGSDHSLYNNITKEFDCETLNSNQLKISTYFVKHSGYFSPRTWTAEAFINVDLTVTYAPKNNNPTITLTQPTSNSPLQYISDCTKEVA